MIPNPKKPRFAIRDDGIRLYENMITRVEAIYEDGVLRPYSRWRWEHERVRITVEPLDDDIDHEFIARCRADLARLDGLPTLKEAQERLRSVPGSFAEEIIRARGER